ncbi:MAG TPA: hypothetical protein GX506_11760, partial [Firmicutes bacterium]|nr:hypothetical protein [Bacillota bacterium]
EVESAVIQEVLREVKGHKAEAARRLGISKTTLWRRLKSMPELPEAATSRVSP